MQIPLALLALSLPLAAQFGPMKYVQENAENDPFGIVLCDVDQDIDLDVVVSNRSDDRVTVLANDGTGDLSAGLEVAVGDRPTCIAAGDLDGDGQVDLVVGNETGQDASILVGGGGGLALTGAVALQEAPRHVVLFDYDADGMLDLSTTPEAQADLELHRNLGAGAFAPAIFVGGAFHTPFHHTAGDLDLDGLTDLLIVGEDSFDYSSWVMLADGAGGFTQSWTSGYAIPTDGMRFASLADLDGDGDLDAVQDGHDSLGAAWSYLGDGAGSLGDEVQYLGGSGAATLGTAAFLHLDDDGLLDFAWVDDGFLGVDDYARFSLGLGGAQFGVHHKVSAPSGLGRLAAGDLDGDGRDAAVITLPGNDAVAIWTLKPDPSRPIEITWINPETILSLASIPTQPVQVHGYGFTGTTSVRLGGVELFAVTPALATVSSDELINLSLPPFEQAGVLPLEVTTPLGSDVGELEIVPPDPPLLKNVAPPGQPGKMSVALGGTLLAGAPAGNLAFLAGSTLNTPTSFPGLLELGIGGGGAMLVLVEVQTVPPPAWTEFGVPVTVGLVGMALHFQVALYDPFTGALPFDTTNKLTVTVIP